VNQRPIESNSLALASTLTWLSCHHQLCLLLKLISMYYSNFTLQLLNWKGLTIIDYSICFGKVNTHTHVNWIELLIEFIFVKNKKKTKNWWSKPTKGKAKKKPKDMQPTRTKEGRELVPFAVGSYLTHSTSNVTCMQIVRSNSNRRLRTSISCQHNLLLYNKNWSMLKSNTNTLLEKLNAKIQG